MKQTVVLWEPTANEPAAAVSSAAAVELVSAAEEHSLENLLRTMLVSASRREAFQPHHSTENRRRILSEHDIIKCQYQ